MKTLALIAMVLACACGKSASKDPPAKTGPGHADPANDPAAPASTGKAGVTGSVTLGGELAGTFAWKDGLAIDKCAWLEPTAAIALTLTNGADAISLEVSKTDDDMLVSVTSDKLHADRYEQRASGVNLSSTDNGAHITAQFNSVASHGDKTETIKGTLQLTCKR